MILRTFLLAGLCLTASILQSLAASPDRPNILWITSEDNGPHIGAYGDSFADTPNIDRIAAMGSTYLNAWSTAPVCAPARTTIISGVYPPATGSQHMRSLTDLPDHMRMYPVYLRELGYYCTNNSKEDYNLRKTGQVWHDSSNQAHWKNREPGQPFFAIFNHTVSHESQIRKRPHDAVHDPAKVQIPAYHPDTPEVRQDWAQYYDKMTEMDERVGRNLRELEEAGLLDDTIIFYYGDHGSGLPRHKRWTYNSGLHIPLIVHIPEKYRHLAPDDYRPGGKTDRLVGFIDLAPTLLSLVGIKPPDYMQGHAFMGRHEAPPQEFLFGFRDRMDERYDLVRAVRDKRFLYIRNYMPHKVYGQYLNYMFQTPTTRVWKQLFDEGKLNAAQSRFWQTKPAEEFYDLKNDPDEVNNLAQSGEHQEILDRLRKAHRDWVFEIRDLGFLPEGEIHQRAEGTTPYEMGHDPQAYPLERIHRAADLASSLKDDVAAELRQAYQDPDSAVRYWAVLGVLMRGKPAVQNQLELLKQALDDSSPYVQVAAAEALGRYGPNPAAKRAVDRLMDFASIKDNGVFVSMIALNALDFVDDKAAPHLAEIKKLPKQTSGVPGRMNSYVPRLLEKTIQDLEEN